MPQTPPSHKPPRAGRGIAYWRTNRESGLYLEYLFRLRFGFVRASNRMCDTPARAGGAWLKSRRAGDMAARKCQGPQDRIANLENGACVQSEAQAKSLRQIEELAVKLGQRRLNFQRTVCCRILARSAAMLSSRSPPFFSSRSARKPNRASSCSARLFAPARDKLSIARYCSSRTS
jgi:hypothetical protein